MNESASTNNASLFYTHLSPAGEGGIGLFQLYGNSVRRVLPKLFECSSGTITWDQGELHYGWVKGEENRRIDEAVLRIVPADQSWTGTDLIELNVHSGRAITRRVSERLESLNARPQDSASFLKRVEQNESMDRIQREAYQELMNIQTRQGSACLLDQLNGMLSDKLLEIEQTLQETRKSTTTSETCNKLQGDVETLIERGRTGTALTTPRSLCIAGPPNAGKSTLMNTLSQSDTSIVHEEAGTTRDVVQNLISFHGYPFSMRDTAGLRSSGERIEQEGMNKSKQAAKEADVTLWVTDPERSDENPPDNFTDIPVLKIMNKEDLRDQPEYGFSDSGNRLQISALREKGIDPLRTSILQVLSLPEKPPRTCPMPFRNRHLQKLKNLLDAIQREKIEEAIGQIHSLLTTQ